MAGSCPHACGGEPNEVQRELIKQIVVPTHVGVNRLTVCKMHACLSCPHACGGEPKSGGIVALHMLLSPRMWG